MQLLEQGGGRRRHLVLEPLPGLPVRLRELHLRVPVLRGAVAGVGLVRAVRRRSRRPSGTSTTWSTSSTCAATSGSTARSPRPCGTRTGVLDDPDRGRVRDPLARYLIATTGVLSVPQYPDVPGREDFRGRGLSPGALAEGAGGLPRQARRRHRHRLDRRPDRPGDRRRGRVAGHVPAHRRPGPPRSTTTRSRRAAGVPQGELRADQGRARRLGRRVPAQAARARMGSTTPRSSGRSSSRRSGTAPGSRRSAPTTTT